MDGNKRKGKPVGLGAKRTKSNDDNPDNDTQDAPEKSSNDTNKGLYIELPEDASQLDELTSLLELAESVADDPEKAIPLLRGVIHECDAIVRAHAEADTDTSTSGMPALDAPFWTCYADAMVLLGQMEFREDAPQVVEFVEQAMEFYDRALQSNNARDVDCVMIEVKRAVAACLLFALNDDYELEDEHVKDVLEREDLKESHKKTFLSGLLEAASEADNCERVITLLQPIITVISKWDDPQISLLRLRLTNFYAESKLEHIVDVDDDAVDNDDDLIELSDTLSKQNNTNNHDNDDHDKGGESFLVRGESKMLQASALELLSAPTPSHAQLMRSLNEDAVVLFKQAEAAGIDLPEGIRDFINGQ